MSNVNKTQSRDTKDSTTHRSKKQGRGMTKMFNNPIYLLTLIALSIFIAEGVIMYILRRHLSPASLMVEGVIDSLLLIILVFPILYVFLLRPMVLHITKRKQAEEELRKYQEYLEELVEERTAEMRVTNEQLEQEVSERQRAEESLRESIQKYRSLFDDALDMVHIVDASGKVADANKIELETLGYSKEEYIGKPLLEIIHPDYQEVTKKAFKRVMNGEKISNYETALVTKNGVKIIVEVSAFPQIENGKVVSARGIIRNVTERKQAEETLKKSEKKHRVLSEQLTTANNMKELLLDVITHDLKNPAGVISGMADMMVDEFPDNKIVEVIKDSSNSLLQVVESATLLSKVAMGEEIRKEEIDLAEVIKKVANQFSPILKDIGMRLENHVSETLIIKANPIIEEVFKNYISNAIKYASEGKRIVIEAFKDNEFVTIGVKDFGQSISKSDYQRIFVRSMRLEKDAKRGRGLGLAIVKRIAEAHKGEVWVSEGTIGEANRKVSSDKPQGNIFYLKMPRK